MPATFAVPAAAQDQPEEPIIITGVVRDIDVSLPPYGDNTSYAHSIRLAGWRQDDEPVQTMVLWIRYETEEALELDELGDVFPSGELVRFSVKDGVRIEGDPDGLQMASAKVAAILPPHPDEEVMEAAAKLLNPPPIAGTEFGTFVATPPVIDNFSQRREWLGQEIRFDLILKPLSPNARERALAMAHIAWKNRKAIDAKIREDVTNQLYSDRAEEAGIALVPVDGEPVAEEADDKPKLSREAFKADHKLIYLQCSAQDFCSYSYVAQEAGWEWSYWATIRRKENSWYLDGWDF